MYGPAKFFCILTVTFAFCLVVQAKRPGSSLVGKVFDHFIQAISRWSNNVHCQSYSSEDSDETENWKGLELCLGMVYQWYVFTNFLPWLKGNVWRCYHWVRDSCNPEAGDGDTHLNQLPIPIATDQQWPKPSFWYCSCMQMVLLSMKLMEIRDTTFLVLEPQLAQCNPLFYTTVS